jgi:hypothetical protein
MLDIGHTGLLGAGFARAVHASSQDPSFLTTYRMYPGHDYTQTEDGVLFW